MGALTAAFMVVIAGGIGIAFYIRFALRRIADKEVETRVAAEVRSMESFIQNSPPPATKSPAVADES